MARGKLESGLVVQHFEEPQQRGVIGPVLVRLQSRCGDQVPGIDARPGHAASALADGLEQVAKAAAAEVYGHRLGALAVRACQVGFGPVQPARGA